MRLAVVRIWAATAAAILAAAAADLITEFAANRGWLGGGLTDNQHESLLPALVAGAALTLALLAFVLMVRVGPRDPLLLRMSEARVKLADLGFAFGTSALCIIVMEGYETRFGGFSPFDPSSVVLSHAPALIVAVLIVGALLHCALRAAIRAAARASSIVAEFFVHFFRSGREIAAPNRTAKLSAFELYVSHRSRAVAGGRRGFRAPPHSSSPSYFRV